MPGEQWLLHWASPYRSWESEGGLDGTRGQFGHDLPHRCEVLLAGPAQPAAELIRIAVAVAAVASAGTGSARKVVGRQAGVPGDRRSASAAGRALAIEQYAYVRSLVDAAYRPAPGAAGGGAADAGVVDLVREPSRETEVAAE